MQFGEWSTNVNTIVGIIGVIVGIIGIVVGVIGGKSLYVATNISNKAKNTQGNLNQAENIYIHNGLDDYAVIKLTKDTTEKELLETVKKISENENRLREAEEKLANQPEIHVGKEGEAIPTLKNGDIYITY